MDGSNGSDGHGRGSEPPGQGHAQGHAQGAAHEPAGAPDLAALARDWIELWQSEVTALAADPETAETWARLAALWAGAAASGLAAMPRGAGGEHAAPHPAPHPAWQPPWAAQAPRATPAPASPEPGGDAARRGAERLLERVLDRLDAIERRLAALEERGTKRGEGGGAGGEDRRGARRRRG